MTQTEALGDFSQLRTAGCEETALQPIPAELLELTLAQAIKVDPNLAAVLLSGSYGGSQVLGNDDFKALQNQTLDKVYAKLSILNQPALIQELAKETRGPTETRRTTKALRAPRRTKKRLN